MLCNLRASIYHLTSAYDPNSDLYTSNDSECTVTDNSLIFKEWKENANNFYLVLN